ncbi:MAG: anti-sigma regulatory factor [Ketobacter sp.]|nr:MAG: anti-sigma regulatory factor [Ketobacter sp.]
MSQAQEGDGCSLLLACDEDVVRLRKAVRENMIHCGFSLIDQTKMITAASELARNALRYADGGTAFIETLKKEGKPGILVSISDKGPGIDDVELALTDGFTTGGGLGLGLSGAKRLTSEFSLDTKRGEGTTVTIVKWK